MVKVVRAAGVPLMAGLLGLIAFLYRFNELGPSALGGFPNDHFAHLVRAQQLLIGEWPLRDYDDFEMRAGLPPAMYAASAAAQLLFGRTLRSEALLAFGGLAGAVAIGVVVAVGLGRSAWVVVPWFVAQILLANNPDGYSKVLPMTVAAAALTVYALRPNLGAAIILGVVTATAALFRHDLGLIAGTAAVGLMASVHTPRGRLRSLLAFAAAGLVLLLPSIVWIQIYSGVPRYVSKSLEHASLEATRTEWSLPRIRVDRAAPLLAPSPSPAAPRVNVRWQRDLPPAVREQLAPTFHLANGMEREPNDWAYDLLDISRANIQALVLHPMVVDTYGIDRERFTVAPPPALPWSTRAMVLFRRILPGYLTTENAFTAMYWLAWLLPIAGLLVALFGRWMSDEPLSQPRYRALAAVSALCLVANAVFLRGSQISRLADAFAVGGIVGAVVTAELWRSAGSAFRGRVLRAAMTVAMAMIIMAAAMLGEAWAFVSAGRWLDGPSFARARFAEAWDDLGRLPASARQGTWRDAIAPAAHYLAACLQGNERVLIAGDYPQLYYFAGRLPAAGRHRFSSSFYRSPADQAASLVRLSRETVPLALLPPAKEYAETFASDYAQLAAWVAANFEAVGELSIGADDPLRVYLRRGLNWPAQWGDGEHRLPCRTMGER